MTDYADITVGATWGSESAVADPLLLQALDGPVRISLKADPTGARGTELQPGNVLRIPPNTAYSHQLMTAAGAILSREVTS